MALKRLPFAREHTGDPARDREQAATYRATQKVNQITGRYAGVGFTVVSLASNFSTTSLTNVDVTGLSLELPAVVGDVFVLDATMFCFVSVGAGVGYPILSVTEGDTTTNVASQGYFSNVLGVTVPLSGIFVATRTGRIRMRPRLSVTAGTGTIYAAPASTLRVQQWRQLA